MRQDRSFHKVEPEEIVFAMLAGDAAAKLKTPVENPSLYGINLVDEKNGKVSRLTFTDNPFNRAMLAVKDHSKGDQFISIMMRILSLHEILENDKLKEWVRISDDGSEEIADALIYAAAKAPLSLRKKFRIRDILRFAKEFENQRPKDSKPPA